MKVAWVCLFEETVKKRFHQTRNLCKEMQLGNEKWVIFSLFDQPLWSFTAL